MRPILTGESGIALFLVLWVLTLLSVIVGEFCYSMRTEVNITRNFKEQTEAYYIAVAGLNRAIGELIRNAVIPRKTEPQDEKEEKGETKEEEEAPRWRANTVIPPVRFGNGQFEVKIGNESGKIDINRANRALLKMIMEGFDIEPKDKDVIVDSILDWRDSNNLHRLNGAEDDYYKSLPDPYECKDADFDTVEELLMVRGVTPEIFYGGLKGLVTVSQSKKSSRKSKRRIKSDNKININAASKRILLALPSMTDELVNMIMEYRKESDFVSLDEVASVVGPGVYQAILPYISLETSSYYTVVSVGKFEGSKIRQGVEAFVEIDKRIKKGYRLVQWRDRLGRTRGKRDTPDSD